MDRRSEHGVRADEINAASGRGDKTAEAKRASRTEMTLDDLFAEYINRNGPHLRRPDKPRDNYRLYLGHWGGRKLAAIKHHEVDSWHKQLARAAWSVRHIGVLVGYPATHDCFLVPAQA